MKRKTKASKPPGRPNPERDPEAGPSETPKKLATDDAPVDLPPPKKKGKWYKFGSDVAVICLLAVLMAGCGSGNARLETGGAYAPAGQAPDYAFYAVESGYALALAAFKTASRLEVDNRDMFWKISPDIKHALDEIRPKALAADRAYARARVAYLKDPTPDGLSMLQTTLGQIQQLATAAVAAVPQQNP